MSEVASALLAWLIDYSYPVVALTVLVAALGVPLPSTAVVLAAGGIAADGDPNPVALAGVVLAAALAGDLLSYAVWRWGGGTALERFGPRVGLTPERVAPLERRFERWGGLLILSTRCVLTGLAAPTNLVAGAGGYPVGHFALYALAGEAIWAGGLVGLGWWYGANWVALLDYLSDAATALTALAVAAGLGYALVRLLRQKPAEPARPAARRPEETRA
jgi:membrane-associated protein